MKRLQVMLRDETFDKIEAAVKKCNDGFADGSVRTQDVVEAMIASGTVDVQKIRARCINVSKLLRNTKIKNRADLKDFVKKLGLVENLLDDTEAS
jgi:hypothetical protein